MKAKIESKMSSRLMVNLILNLNIRVKRVADTKKSEIKLEYKGQVGGRHQNKPTRERPKLLGRFLLSMIHAQKNVLC